MKHTFRSINLDRDYPTLESWWEAWGFPDPVAKSILPPETGYFLKVDEVPVCAAWLYLTNSSIASIAWYISDRKLPKEYRSGMVEAITAHLEKEARELGYAQIVVNIQHHLVPNKLKNLGYRQGDKYLVQLEKVII